MTDINEIDTILDKLFKTNYSISICPFYEIKNEYRVIMLNGEKKLLYAKYLPIVIGNGKKTIRQLLLEFNPIYFKDKLKDSKYDKILNDKEKFEYNWKFNLSQGSIAKMVENKSLEEKLIQIAKDVCNNINLRFGSIDIVETINGKLLVLEANSGVMIDNYIKLNPNEYNLVKEIYKEAVESLLEN